jgi:hypothetical protein
MKLALVIGVAIFLAFLCPIDVGAQKGWKSYSVEDEFSFKYPSNWKLQERENRFTTIDAQLKYGNNDVQMIFDGLGTMSTKTDDEIVEALKTVIEDKKSANVFDSGIDKQMTNNRTAPYVIGTYSTESLFGMSLDMVELITAVRLPNGEVVLVQYIAEENDFDKYLPKVKQVINSILPMNSTNNVPTVHNELEKMMIKS